LLLRGACCCAVLLLRGACCCAVLLLRTVMRTLHAAARDSDGRWKMPFSLRGPVSYGSARSKKKRRK
jgi:hypothetical protein